MINPLLDRMTRQIRARVRPAPKASETWPKYTDRVDASLADWATSRAFSQWSGPLVDEFSSVFSELTGCRFILPTPNGTAAIALASYASRTNLSESAEVALPAYGHVSLLSATPRGTAVSWLDSRVATSNVDPELLGRGLDGRSVVVTLTGTWGLPPQVETVRDRVGEHGTILLDASHLAGVLTPRGDPVTGHADVSAMSLGFGKAVSGGELGLLATNDEHIFRLAAGAADPKLGGDQAWANGPLSKSRPHALALVLALDSVQLLPERLQRQRTWVQDVLSATGPVCALAPQMLTPERAYQRLAFRSAAPLDPSVLALCTTELRTLGYPVLDEEYPIPLSRLREGEHAPTPTGAERLCAGGLHFRAFSRPDISHLAEAIGSAVAAIDELLCDVVE